MSHSDFCVEKSLCLYLCLPHVGIFMLQLLPLFKSITTLPSTSRILLENVLPPLEYKLHDGRDFCLFCPLICPQCQEQCLAHSRHSTHICQTNAEIFSFFANVSCLICFVLNFHTIFATLPSFQQCFWKDGKPENLIYHVIKYNLF